MKDITLRLTFRKAIELKNGFVIFDSDPTELKKIDGYYTLNNGEICYLYLGYKLPENHITNIDSNGFVHISSEVKLDNFINDIPIDINKIDEFIKWVNEKHVYFYKIRKQDNTSLEYKGGVVDISKIPKAINSYHLFSKEEIIKPLLEGLNLTIKEAIESKNGFVIFDSDPKKEPKKLDGYYVLNNGEISYIYLTRKIPKECIIHVDSEGFVHISLKFKIYKLTDLIEKDTPKQFRASEWVIRFYNNTSK